MAKLYMIFQSTELITELQTIVSETKSDSVINLVGKVEHEDLKYWYNSAELIVSSSHYEGSGVAVCEGLSCGCIPILTDIPSFRMMTDDGRIGMLYPAGDETALLNTLSRSLQINREEMKRLVLRQFHAKLSFEASARSIMEAIHTL